MNTKTAETNQAGSGARKVLRLCSACRHQVVPARPQLFAPRAVASAGTTTSVNDWLEDEFSKRKIEESRVAEGYPLDYRPRFFSWCKKLTLSEEKANRICDELMAGNDADAREALKEGQIVIDYANGIVLPIYVICTRANPHGNCGAFEPR